MKRKKTPKQLQYEADEIKWKKQIRGKIKACIRCGSTKQTHCAHIISRTNHATRWHKLNGIVLCRACHFYWQPNHPIEFAIMVRDYRGNRVINSIYKQAYPNGEKYDYQNK